MAKKGREIEGDGNGHSQATIDGSMRPSSEEISARAYSIYEREGRGDGRDQDHWLQAERELLDERRNSGRGSMASGPGVKSATPSGPTASSPSNTEPRSARRSKGM